MKKNSKIIILIVIIAVVIAGGLLLLNNKGSKLKTNATKTEISSETTGYRLDLRIFGTYNKKKINIKGEILEI